MKKMNTKEANKIFNEINDKWDDVLSLTYGKSKIPVKVYCNIPITVITTIANLVTELSCNNNSFNYINCRMVLARCIVDLLTDIPVPTVKNEETGEDSGDFNTCYEIVYGVQYGLVNDALFKTHVVDVLEDYVFGTIDNSIAENNSQNVLAQRVFETGSALFSTLNDLVENPVALTDFLESLSNAEAEE